MRLVFRNCAEYTEAHFWPRYFFVFSQSFECNPLRCCPGIDLKVSLEPIPCTAFPVHSTLTIPSFDAVYHESYINK